MSTKVNSHTCGHSNKDFVTISNRIEDILLLQTSIIPTVHMYSPNNIFLSLKGAAPTIKCAKKTL